MTQDGNAQSDPTSALVSLKLGDLLATGDTNGAVYALRQCRHGPMLFNRRDMYIGRSLDAYGEYSEAEIAVLRQILRPGAVVVEAGARPVEQPAAQYQPIESRPGDGRLHVAHRGDGRGRGPLSGDVMRRALVRPGVAAAGVDHGDALLQDARHSGAATGAHPDDRPLAPQPIVLRVVTTRCGRRGQRRGQVQRHVATGEPRPQRGFVEDVGRHRFRAACRGDGRRRRPPHQRAYVVAGRGQARQQMTPIHSGRTENGYAHCSPHSAEAR